RLRRAPARVPARRRPGHGRGRDALHERTADPRWNDDLRRRPSGRVDRRCTTAGIRRRDRGSRFAGAAGRRRPAAARAARVVPGPRGPGRGCPRPGSGRLGRGVRPLAPRRPFGAPGGFRPGVGGDGRSPRVSPVAFPLPPPFWRVSPPYLVLPPWYGPRRD